MILNSPLLKQSLMSLVLVPASWLESSGWESRSVNAPGVPTKWLALNEVSLLGWRKIQTFAVELCPFSRAGVEGFAPYLVDLSNWFPPQFFFIRQNLVSCSRVSFFCFSLACFSASSCWTCSSFWASMKSFRQTPPTRNWVWKGQGDTWTSELYMPSCQLKCKH